MDPMAKTGKRSTRSTRQDEAYEAWNREREARARVAFFKGSGYRQGQLADDPLQWYRDHVQAEVARGGFHEKAPADRRAWQVERAKALITKRWPNGDVPNLSAKAIRKLCESVLGPEDTLPSGRSFHRALDRE
jgi:hypothetical protein